jgi:hypothetical protein
LPRFHALNGPDRQPGKLGQSFLAPPHCLATDLYQHSDLGRGHRPFRMRFGVHAMLHMEGRGFGVAIPVGHDSNPTVPDAGLLAWLERKAAAAGPVYHTPDGSPAAKTKGTASSTDILRQIFAPESTRPIKGRQAILRVSYPIKGLRFP